jgi:hypothetical protein
VERPDDPARPYAVRFFKVLVVLVVLVGALVGAWRLFGQAEVGRDGPLVVKDAAWWPPFDQGGFEALIGGELRIDGDCAFLGDGTVVWPDGTEWDADEQAVRLPNGVLARDGDLVEGGGGSFGGPEDAHFFEDSAIANAIGDCREPGDEVAIFNTREDVQRR